jgi:nucleotide-binding universal stress UspA family protein
MIKDVMVRLDGTPADDVRLAAVGQIAEIFDSHITGLLFNALSPLVPDGSSGAGANEVTRLLDAARQAGHDIEATVFQRLAKLPYPVALRPNGRASEPDGLVENLLFGAGRHLFLVPDDLKPITPFETVIVAWNGSRESARALAEAVPYLLEARKVGVLVIESPRPTEAEALIGNDAVHHLRHHGINAVKYRAVGQEDEIAEALIEECRKLDANLLVMGSYGHSRLHELLPGSTTDRMLRQSPFPLLVAH